MTEVSAYGPPPSTMTHYAPHGDGVTVCGYLGTLTATPRERPSCPICLGK